MTILCSESDLVPNSGVCAVFEKDGQVNQVAIFFLPDTQQKLFAIGNWDPLGKANVLSRGIVGNVGDHIVVASPLYKQHFDLVTGDCLEEEVSVPVYDVHIDNSQVVIAC